MSNHEQFAQVNHQKRAIMSESLRSLTNNEKMSESLIVHKNKQFAQKTDEQISNPDPERRSSGSGKKVKRIWREGQADLERSAIIAAMERSSSGSGEKFKRI